MKHLKFYVQGEFGNNQVSKTLQQHPSGVFIPTDSISVSDLVIWTGGEDISPKLYGESNVACGYLSDSRDRADMCAVKVADGKLKIGICRGAQLLNVTNGGKLWQDVDGHESTIHECKDYLTGGKVFLNSVHHQMMRPGPKAVVICGTDLSQVKYGYEKTWSRKDSMSLKKVDVDRIDVEAVWYEDTMSLCFQPHPEYSNAVGTRDYFYSLLDRFILSSKRAKAA